MAPRRAYDGRSGVVCARSAAGTRGGGGAGAGASARPWRRSPTRSRRHPPRGPTGGASASDRPRSRFSGARPRRRPGAPRRGRPPRRAPAEDGAEVGQLLVEVAPLRVRVRRAVAVGAAEAARRLRGDRLDDDPLLDGLLAAVAVRRRRRRRAQRVGERGAAANEPLVRPPRLVVRRARLVAQLALGREGLLVGALHRTEQRVTVVQGGARRAIVPRERAAESLLLRGRERGARRAAVRVCWRRRGIGASAAASAASALSAEPPPLPHRMRRGRCTPPWRRAIPRRGWPSPSRRRHPRRRSRRRSRRSRCPRAPSRRGSRASASRRRARPPRSDQTGAGGSTAGA